MYENSRIIKNGQMDKKANRQGIGTYKNNRRDHFCKKRQTEPLVSSNLRDIDKSTVKSSTQYSRTPEKVQNLQNIEIDMYI